MEICKLYLVEIESLEIEGYELVSNFKAMTVAKDSEHALELTIEEIVTDLVQESYEDVDVLYQTGTKAEFIEELDHSHGVEWWAEFKK